MKNVKLSSAIQSYHKLLTQTQFKIKHIRVLIIYTHQFKCSVYDLIDSESKQLTRSIRIPILLFKIIQQGHLLNTLEIVRLDRYCFGPLGELLKFKIKLHTSFHEFDGQLKYEEFIALKYSQVVDVGFNVVTLLLEYLSKCESCMQHYLNQLSTTSQNTELLVLMTSLILESYNTYIYILHIGRALHKRIADVDSLSIIRSDYKARADLLSKLFDQCRRWKQLLIYMDIPSIKYLDMMEYDDIENEQIEFRDIDDAASEVSFGMTEQRSEEFIEPQMTYQQPIQQLPPVQQIQQPPPSTVSQDQYNNINSQLAASNNALQALQAKYNQLAQLYQQLRTEHLQLLDKYNTLQSSHDPHLQSKLKEKQLQLADMMKQRDDLARQLSSARENENNSEMQRENELLKLQLRQSKTDGSSMYLQQIKKLQLEIQQTQQLLQQQQQKYNELQSNYTAIQALLNEKTEELQIVQLSMDQALMSMNNGNDQMQMAKSLDNVLDNMLISIVQQIDVTMQQPRQIINNVDAVFITLLDALPFDQSTHSIVEWLNTNDRTLVMKSMIQLGFKALIVLDSKIPHELAILLNDFGLLIREYINQLQSSNLVKYTNDHRLQLVNNQHSLIVQKRLELLAKADALMKTSNKDLSVVMNTVQSEMKLAQQQLQDLLKLNVNGVHSKIIKQCLLLADLLNYFVTCCINCQQEIISHSNEEIHSFYKKNNRWTQGLISAAQVH
eukprot:NODE_625_length_5889_cov_0.576339.p1 type:complete len:725 gc:universal NODE_625_length_5889_cov_0.576339:4583-2409(-)